MKKIIFIVLLAAIADLVYTKPTYPVTGKVEHNNEGVPFLSVIVKGTTIGCITNEEGEFNLPNAPSGEIVLRIYGLGFKTLNYPVINTIGQEKVFLSIEKDILLLEEIVVSGSRLGMLRYLPGTINIIKPEELLSTMPVSANEVLRNIPGVHVVDEEGAGLRINIGIRGLDPDKSRNVLMLEDGIPVALAPYGEPEMYYSPNIERMHGVEILKGNGSILFGPQTTGGVINYITPDPGHEPNGLISFKAGDFGYNNTFLNFGNTVNNIGYNINYNRKQAQNFGPTRFLLHDVNSKFLLSFSPKSKLSLKLGIYDENSNSTYVGITQAMFDTGDYDYLRIAPDDKLHIRRYAIGALHKYLIKDGLQLNTTVFAYSTTRNWNRQDFTYNPNASNLTGVVHGLDNDKEGAIYMRNRTGQRNRQFEVGGIESRLSYRYTLLNTTSKLDAGVRYLYEKAFEQRINGTKAGVFSGNIQEDEIRTGNAFSSFFQNKVLINENLSVTTGLRTENIWYEREIYRLQGKDTLIGNATNDFALIPGAGITWNFSESTCLFSGIHRGYAPPRTKDAITNQGEDLELEAEKSWTYELGMRIHKDILKMEFTAFYMDFSNQVIPVSESSGGIGTGYINGGATTHKGVEMSILLPMYNFSSEKWNNSLVLSGTYVDSRFSNDRYVLEKTTADINKTPIFTNVKGNKTPYAPELTVSSALVAEYSKKAGIKFIGNYIGRQYTDALNTNDVNEWILIENDNPEFTYQQATLNGRIGLMKAYFISDVSVWYNSAKTGLEFNLSIKNIFNERYITSRRPQGIRAGMPRFISAGVLYSF